MQPFFFCNQPTRAGRIHTHGYAQPRTDTHTHLASLACVVSCWRLVACLCRFARSLCVCVSVVSKCIHCARVGAVGQIWREAITRRKLFCNQTFFATNQCAQDVYTHGYAQPRTDTHTPRLSRVCCLLLAPRSFSLSVRPQPVCVWAGGVLSVMSKCNHCCPRACALGQILSEAITHT